MNKERTTFSEILIIILGAVFALILLSEIKQSIGVPLFFIFIIVTIAVIIVIKVFFQRNFFEKQNKRIHYSNHIENYDDLLNIDRQKISMNSSAVNSSPSSEENTTVKEEMIEPILLEYKLPSISLVNDNESKKFKAIYQKLKNKKGIQLPIGEEGEKFIIENIASMPNLLIGGTVMSGKTSFVNALISSILLTKKPDEVKLVIYDSKRVEYSIYRGIPHLLTPIITDPRKLAVALKHIWLEVERRYEILEKNNCKNIDAYNAFCESHLEFQKISSILVVIDDLTLVNSEEVDEFINYITSSGWNVNVYMIVVANHPSSRIISTISKSNFPARICFKTADAKTSQIILNESGAEKLCGIGNAFYISRQMNDIIKVKVPFITDSDIQKIVLHVIEQQIAKYDETLLMDKAEMNASSIVEEQDVCEEPLYNQMVEFVIAQKRASTSLLQRKFKIGYHRAVRAIDLLEERGIIGPANGEKPREVYMFLEEDK